MPFAAVMSPSLLLEDEHLAARGFFQPVEQPGLGPLPSVGPAFKMSATPLRQGPAPALGTDTDAVLSSLDGDGASDG